MFWFFYVLQFKFEIDFHHDFHFDFDFVLNSNLKLILNHLNSILTLILNLNSVLNLNLILSFDVVFEFEFGVLSSIYLTPQHFTLLYFTLLYFTYCNLVHFISHTLTLSYG